MFDAVIKTIGKIARLLRGESKLVEVMLTLVLLVLSLVLSFDNVIKHGLDAWKNRYSSTDDNLDIAVNSLIVFTFISVLLIFIPPMFTKFKARQTRESSPTGNHQSLPAEKKTIGTSVKGRKGAKKLRGKK